MYHLKPISVSAIPAALEKAERYRLLNEPESAESICLDVLDVDSQNQLALVTLLLARTDQFGMARGGADASAREVLPRLASPYERAYYAGLIAERRAKALLNANRPGSQTMAWHSFREAMEAYEQAIGLRPSANDEAVLRWNTCARLMNAHPQMEPRGEEEYQPVVGD